MGTQGTRARRARRARDLADSKSIWYTSVNLNMFKISEVKKKIENFDNAVEFLLIKALFDKL